MPLIVYRPQDDLWPETDQSGRSQKLKITIFVLIVLTIALIAVPVAAIRSMMWVDGPSGPEPFDADRCDEDDYFYINESHCEGGLILYVVCLLAILFLAWLSSAFFLWGQIQTRRSQFSYLPSGQRKTLIWA